MQIHLYTTQRELEFYKKGENCTAWTKSFKPYDASFHISVFISEVEIQDGGKVKILKNRVDI